MSCPSFPGCATPPEELPTIVGTAPTEDAYCLLELPKPWPAKIKKMEGLVQEIRATLKAHKAEDVSLLATPELPWESEIEGPRLVLLRWNGETTLCQELPAEPSALSAALLQPPQGEPKPLYLVCTHGSRDPCCGLLGVPVHQRLQEITERAVVQSSHLGGHRFAPVVAAFPEWKFYGHISPEDLAALDDDLANGRPHLRGYRGFGRLREELQAFEAALWARHGKPVTCVRRLSSDDHQWRVSAIVGDEALTLTAELEHFRYRGFKSCKDFRKDKISHLEIPVLKGLTTVHSEPAAERCVN